MAEGAAATPIELRSIQQGLDTSRVDYYDIMVIGRTGMGKSTTSDKLVIANLDGRDYGGEQHTEGSVQDIQVAMSDLSIWLISDVEGEIDRVTNRLKNLVMFRSLEKPHEEVNAFYSGMDDNSTKKSQLISNETSKVRVLDVPGFFGPEDEASVASSEGETEDRVTAKGLAIMREILRVQAAMHMNFRRIIYFLPDRGALERSHAILRKELELMVYYFGKSIFDCMVLIATVNPDVYQYIPPDVVPFSADAERKTRQKFHETLANVLPGNDRLPFDKPPIVFLSMNDSCEDMYWKIKHAGVIVDEVRLTFNKSTCTRCGIKVKSVRENQTQVACYPSNNPSNAIAYEESLCHPMIIAKYWKLTKILGGVAHFVTRKKYLGRWPDFHNPDDEICISCKGVPGSRGCMVVKSRFKPKGKGGELLVDHHCELDEPIVVVAND